MTTQNLNVLILGYMRFEGILRNLKACSKAGISKVYLAMDGGRDSLALKEQDERLVEILDFAKLKKIDLKVRRRYSNAGLAVGVIEGISWFFDHVDFGVILEDDLHISPDFFTFISEAQEKINSREVFMISGNNYLKSKTSKELVITNYPLIWGWATWSNSWSEFMATFNNHFIPNFNLRCSPSVNAFWLTADLQSRFGNVDSWAMSFSSFARMTNRLCVMPPVNLVSNSGTDALANHTTERDSFIRYPLGKLSSPLSWSFPEAHSIREANSYLENFVFNISTRNLLSPLKFSIQFLYKRRRKPLSTRLRESAIASSLELIEGGM